MRLILFAALVGGAALATAASAAERGYPITGFAAVALDGVDDVDVHVGPGFSVRAEGDAAVLDDLDIRRERDTLHVGRKHRVIGWSGQRGRAHVVVTLPALHAARLAGTGALRVDQVSGPRFDASLSGTGTLSVDRLTVREAVLDASGTGTIRVAGSVERLRIGDSGVGNIDARGLRAATADVSASGTGNVVAQVTGPARVSLSGMGSVDLGPAARCTVAKSGFGSVRCGR